MPIPKPKPGESKDDFIGRCMEAQAGEDKPQDQKLAICNDIWENRSRAVEPRELDRDEVMARLDTADLVTHDLTRRLPPHAVLASRTCWPAVRRFVAGESDRLYSLFSGGEELVLGERAVAETEPDQPTDGDRPPRERTMSFIASTEVVGRDFDSIKAEAWKLAHYRKNPVFLWAHDYAEKPIGRALSTRNTDAKLLQRILFTAESENPNGEAVLRLYKGGYLNAVSVGYIPLEFKFVEDQKRPFGLDITAADLLEVSAVPVPANPEALLEARSAGHDLRWITDWCGRALDTWQTERTHLPLGRRAVEAIRRQAGGDVLYRSAAVPRAPELRRVAPGDLAAELAGVEDLVPTAPGARGYYCGPADDGLWSVYRAAPETGGEVLVFEHLTRDEAARVVARKNTPKGSISATAETPLERTGAGDAPPAVDHNALLRQLTQTVSAQLGPALSAELRRLTGRLD